MKDILGKDCYVIHRSIKNGETCVKSIEKGKIRYGNYKLYIYEDNELYFKEALENIHVKKSGNKVIICTRDKCNYFEVNPKQIDYNVEIIDMALINNVLCKNIIKRKNNQE